MGNCNFKTETVDKTSTLSISTFNFHYVIGRGGFGKVWKVERKSNKVVYAMKEMSKSRIISKKSVASVMNERHLLSVLKHPFLVNMVAAFQDRENLYLIMDLMTGGDLRYHISRRKKFTEEQTKFFIACIISSLEYLHNQGILHRDIKPENLVFDAQGYLRITDFGIARVWKADNSNETSGTPGYMAPEVMCRQNHGISVDYYALGVIAYECMLGRRPYVGRNRKEIRDQILAKQVQLRRTDIPENWSLESADFINKLIQRKPINRLGQEGPSEVKNHPWLKDFPWGKLHDKELEPPFNPNEDQLGVKQSVSNTNWDDENSDVMKQNAILLRRGSVQELFNGYNFDLTITTTMTTSGPLTPNLKQSNSKHFVQSPSLSSQTPRLISSPTSVEPHQPSMQKEF